MSVLTPKRREAPASVGMSTSIGVLKRRGLRAMCPCDVWSIRACQPRMVGIDCPMCFIPSRGQGRARLHELLDDPAAGDRAGEEAKRDLETWPAARVGKR